MFKEWLKLNETVSVYVSGIDHSEIRDIHQLAYVLQQKAFGKLSPKIDPERLNKMLQRYHNEIIIPDGSYYGEKQEPIINVYTDALTYMETKELLYHIGETLKDMRIKFTSLGEQTSGMYGGKVHRIRIDQMPQTDYQPELNIANANAKVIFDDILGYDFSDYHLTIDASDLLIKIGNLSKDMLDIHQRDPYMTKKDGGPTTYHGDLSREHLERYLQQLAKIAQWALKQGYTTLEIA